MSLGHYDVGCKETAAGNLANGDSSRVQKIVCTVKREESRGVDQDPEPEGLWRPTHPFASKASARYSSLCSAIFVGSADRPMPILKPRLSRIVGRGSSSLAESV